MEKQNYSTTDLGEASALICSGFEVIGIDKAKKYKQIVFEETKELQKAIVKYWDKKLSVDALTLNNQVQNLRTRVLT